MQKLFIALAMAVMAAGSAAASDKSDVMSVIHQWVDGFKKGATGWLITGWAWADH